MKAYALLSADQPASLVVLPDPDVRSDSVRVRIRAASVNGFDVFQAGGQAAGLMEHRFPTVVGRDFAGVVDAVGADRTDLHVGDEVLGFVPTMLPLHDGTYAEAVAGAGLVFARKPAGLSFEIAATLPLAGAAALDAVDAVAIGPGDTVLIAGATGGVGHIAVQLAAQRGATVIATARAGDEEAFVRALGATETVDYASGDVADAIRARFPDGLTALIDFVNRGDAFTRLTGLVRPGGRVATTLVTADAEALAGREIRATNVMAAPTPEKLTSLATQVAAGALRVKLQKTFPLADAHGALEAFQAGTLGKVVVVV